MMTSANMIILRNSTCKFLKMLLSDFGCLSSQWLTRSWRTWTCRQQPLMKCQNGDENLKKMYHIVKQKLWICCYTHSEHACRRTNLRHPPVTHRLRPTRSFWKKETSGNATYPSSENPETSDVCTLKVQHCGMNSTQLRASSAPNHSENMTNYINRRTNSHSQHPRIYGAIFGRGNSWNVWLHSNASNAIH